MAMNEASFRRSLSGLLVLAAGLAGLAIGGCGASRVVPEREVIMVTATYETQAVASADDAADDACVWVNPLAGKAGSGVQVPYTVIGTDKKRGLMVYAPVGSGRGGEVMQEVLDGRMNNVEIVHGVITAWSGTEASPDADVVFATNRTSNSVSAYVVDRQTGRLTRLGGERPLADLVEVYGIAAYEDPRDLVVKVVVACKSGLLVRYEADFVMQDSEKQVKLTEIDRATLGTQIEGVAADVVHRRLFVGEEAVGAWVFDLDNLQSRTLMDSVLPAQGGKLAADVEGIAIISDGFGKDDSGQGYVLVSAQSEDRFAVYDRASMKYLCSIGFAMANGDRVTHTDGITVGNRPAGVFARGLVVVQDDNAGKPQDFKVIDVRRVLEAIEQRGVKK